MKTQILCFVTLCVLTYGCNTNPPVQTAATDSLNTVADNDTIIENTEQQTAQYLKIGDELLKNESFGSLKLELSAAKTKEVLGTPEKTSKAEEWETDGEIHQTWQYQSKGIELDMIGKEEQVINMITIKSPSTLKTSKNIGIGSTEAEVKAAYDSAIDKTHAEAGEIVAGTVYGGIIFGIENGTVKSIFAGAAAE